MNITVYCVEDVDGDTIWNSNHEVEPQPNLQYRDAQKFAQKNHGKVICHEYEWSDSYLIWDADDYTGTNSEI